MCENVECSTVGLSTVELPTEVSNEDVKKMSIIFSGVIPKVLPVIAIPFKSVPCGADTIAEDIYGESVDCGGQIDKPNGSEKEYLDVELEEIVSLAYFIVEGATNIETPDDAQQPHEEKKLFLH
ncbi:hypothetical protein K7X08_005127 [Anisodus acutangulus]|uniref:Uncharacterized protein n=1 Tax=Anisodus acutangulus TaxID=402998 RepID=A0A9Q1RJC7_9SOLA|nr:hypothetical protein K7X08_005127 [Anisodus acutangulus]